MGWTQQPQDPKDARTSSWSGSQTSATASLSSKMSPAATRLLGKTSIRTRRTWAGMATVFIFIIKTVEDEDFQATECSGLRWAFLLSSFPSPHSWQCFPPLSYCWRFCLRLISDNGYNLIEWNQNSITLCLLNKSNAYFICLHWEISGWLKIIIVFCVIVHQETNWCPVYELILIMF